MRRELPAHGHREHVALCLEGKLNTELKDGRVFVLKYAEVGPTLFAR